MIYFFFTAGDDIPFKCGCTEGTPPPPSPGTVLQTAVDQGHVATRRKRCLSSPSQPAAKTARGFIPTYLPSSTSTPEGSYAGRESVGNFSLQTSLLESSLGSAPSMIHPDSADTDSTSDSGASLVLTPAADRESYGNFNLQTSLLDLSTSTSDSDASLMPPPAAVPPSWWRAHQRRGWPEVGQRAPG